VRTRRAIKDDDLIFQHIQKCTSHISPVMNLNCWTTYGSFVRTA
jgi:hypothetical protein